MHGWAGDCNHKRILCTFMPKSMFAMLTSVKKCLQLAVRVCVCVVGALQQLVVQLARLIKIYDEKL